MPRLMMTIAYMGTKKYGWQSQPNGLTVQDRIESCFARICGEPVRIHGSGRTDAGVHALGQVAHVDVPDSKMHVPWRKALNALLPSTISILDVHTVPDDFHARFGAKSKTYSYTLWTEFEFVLPQRAPFVWQCGALDVAAMDAAAEEFMGTHDFSAFQNTGTDVKTTERTITRLERSSGQHPAEIVWLVSADGFLKQMVRNIVGCLVAAGKGKIRPADVRALIASRDRTLAPATAPPQGLCLEHVIYPNPETA